jgi:hypothetical protein
LRPEKAGGRVWLSYRRFGWGTGRVQGLGFELVQSAQGRTRRGGRPAATLGLWDELPFGLRYSSNL